MALRALEARIGTGEAVVGGVLSGTSADGIDVGLARFRANARGELRLDEVSAFAVEPFPGPLAERVRAVLDGVRAGGTTLDLRGVALLHRDLGRAFGTAARRVAEREGLALELVGSHGQTVWHHDDVEPTGPATLQLGDGDEVAETAGCCVVSDFRQRDVAAGGGGAPLSAYADDLLFAAAPGPVAVLNLGGLANVSWLPGAEGPTTELLSFDTGPAGSLLDGLARRLLDAPLDRDGAAAAAGRADSSLVEELLEHPFFTLPAPKSTGRDTFGEDYVSRFLERAGSRPRADLLASAVQLVVESVALGIERYLPSTPRAVYVAGGGVHHRPLLEGLSRRIVAPVMPSSEIGVDPDAREALVFAALAARAVAGESVTRPSATGAAQGRVLGKISPPAGLARPGRARTADEAINRDAHR